MHKLFICSAVLALASGNVWAGSDEEDVPSALDEGGEQETGVEIDAGDVLDRDPTAGVQPADIMMVLPEKQVYLQVFVPISLSTDAVFKPVSLAPDLWIGVKPKLTVGLTHSSHASTGFFGGFANGICFVGEDNNCPHVLSNTALQVRYALPVKTLALAAEGGLVFRAYDPFTIALKAGVVGRWQRKALSVLFGLNLFAGLNERDPDAAGNPGNKENLNIPITALYAVTAKAAVGVQTGIGLPLEDTGDFYFVPLALGGRYMVTRKANVDLIFTLPFLLSGNDELSGADIRVLTLAGGYAF